MQENRHRIGWIGIGRMGFPMAERLAKGGVDLSIWNRTRSKAEPLAASGAQLVDRPSDLSGHDILFTMVSTGADLDEVMFGAGGVVNGRAGPLPEHPGRLLFDRRRRVRLRSALALTALGSAFLSAPVSGNGKVAKAGKLSCVVSGPEATFEVVKPYLETIAPQGVAYVGEGELARICKIAHNVMLGVVIQNLAEITLLAEKVGRSAPRFSRFHEQLGHGLDVHAATSRTRSSTSTGRPRSPPLYFERTSTSAWRMRASSKCRCR